jgi:hypothetical protein
VDTETQWISGPNAFDAPKNRPINLTSFDWWYFDVVQQPDANGEQPSFALTFHSTGVNGFDPVQELFPLGAPSDNLVQIDLAWPNGDTDTWALLAGEAIFTIDGDGASANYTGTGSSFEGAPDLSQYSVHINAPEKGIVGSLLIQSVKDASMKSWLRSFPANPKELIGCAGSLSLWPRRRGTRHAGSSWCWLVKCHPRWVR